MGNIVDDIVEEVQIKPKNTKKIIKWIVSGAITLIGVAFALGQFKASFFNRMDTFETALNKNTASIEQLSTNVDVKIDKVYDDGVKIFNDFQEYNTKQLGLIIDYGSENKDMLKRMLELQNMERARSLETQVEQAKKEEPIPTYKGEVEFIPVEDDPNLSISVTSLRDEPFMNELLSIEVETNDTLFHITGALNKYYESIDRNKYEVGALRDSQKYPNRYDFSYRNKR